VKNGPAKRLLGGLPRIFSNERGYRDARGTEIFGKYFGRGEALLEKKKSRRRDKLLPLKIHRSTLTNGAFKDPPWGDYFPMLLSASEKSLSRAVLERSRAATYLLPLLLGRVTIYSRFILTTLYISLPRGLPYLGHLRYKHRLQ